MHYALFILLFLGLLIRVLLIGNPGFIADISFWKSWSLAASDHGIVWTAFNTNINYPPGFIWVLFLMGKMYLLFGDPHNFEQYWRENNFSFLLVAKSIAIFSDIAVTLIIYFFASNIKFITKLGGFLEEKTQRFVKVRFLPLLLATAFYLNPTVIINSALWGQVESFGFLFTLIALMMIFRKKPALGSIFYAIGCLMKLQNIIYIPLYFLFIFRYFGIKTVFKSLLYSMTAFFIVTFPFLLENKMERVLLLMIVNNDYFPWLSLNAHNLWWIVAGAKGMEITDKITVLGILNAKSVGLILFSSFYFLSALLIFLKATFGNFLLALTFGIFSFFLFSTQSHERYSYPVLVLMLLYFPFLSVKNSWKTRYPPKEIFFWSLYFLLSIVIFFNIHTGLILNYPKNGFDFITSITTPQLTILNSYMHIALYLMFLPLFAFQLGVFPALIPFILISGGLIFMHLGYFITGKVSLTAFRPIIMRQDYGQLVKNRSVNSTDQWKTWSRLSNNYFYYRKGFGSHANSTNVFDINRKFSRFATDIGVDTEANTPATVIFKIYGDDKLLFESKKMGRFDFPLHADVDVKNVKLLKLEITDAGDGINSDHADWLNPVLYK